MAAHKLLGAALLREVRAAHKRHAGLIAENGGDPTGSYTLQFDPEPDPKRPFTVKQKVNDGKDTIELELSPRIQITANRAGWAALEAALGGG